MTSNHSKERWGITLLVGVSLASFATADAKEPPLKRPNVVLFLVDDLGWSDVGCYGSKFHESPNIDRFAKAGMQFWDAYAACPVCSPTRASIMSGKYPATLGLTDFIPGHQRPWAKLNVPPNAPNLPLEEVTIAEALKTVGYTTGYFGKWHLGGPTHYPPQQGFDESIVTSGRHFAPKFRTAPKVDVPKNASLAEFLTEKSEGFMEKNREKPFFLFVAHYLVHIPLEARAENISKYEAKPKPPEGINHPVYAAMVQEVDESFGRILGKLKELGLSENTVVIFTSDNGGLTRRFDGGGEAVTTNAPLRDEKGSLYEGGIRVPLLVDWKGHIPAGSESRVPVSTVDLLPTIVDLAGVPKPERPHVDGVSLVPILEGGKSLDRAAIYWHYPHYHHSTPASAIRAGDYKLLEFFEDGHRELYNLKSDIGESNDLASAKPQKTTELAAQLDQWRKKVGAKLPTANPNHDPERASQWSRRYGEKRPRKAKAGKSATSPNSNPTPPR
ncbi:Arylsulfatase [Planctomycetes bacterium Pan216]|uniref:Arylsulfatase n=1 Tax=Kolteria novifilia TaxID=2527975 RepID=A0A518BBA7_9BACT|nr:Arylsulfatase [Planctomycetes bacterium Pan216]